MNSTPNTKNASPTVITEKTPYSPSRSCKPSGKQRQPAPISPPVLSRRAREPATRRWWRSSGEAAGRRARHAGERREVGRQAAGASSTGWWEGQAAWGREGQAAGRGHGCAVGARGREGERRHAAAGRSRRWDHALRERRRAGEAGRGDASWEGEGRRGEALAWLVLRQHGVGVGLAFGSVGGGDGVDDGLGLLVADLLVVVDNVSQMVSTAVVRLPHTHGVVREVDIAIVTKELGHLDWLAWSAWLAFGRSRMLCCAMGNATVDHQTDVGRWSLSLSRPKKSRQG